MHMPKLHAVSYCRAKQQTETGRIVNLMSADVNNVMVRCTMTLPLCNVFFNTTCQRPCR
jgi:hypothetical protein